MVVVDPQKRAGVVEVAQHSWLSRYRSKFHKRPWDFGRQEIQYEYDWTVEERAYRSAIAKFMDERDHSHSEESESIVSGTLTEEVYSAI